MYAGNHTPCHPLDTLVKAAELLREDPRIRFCFVGGGIDWLRLRNRAREEHAANMIFLGYQPFDRLPAVLSAADLQVVVMGAPFVGISHPCKVYNFLAAQRPFLYIGPERSHIADLIRDAGLDQFASSFRHGEAQLLADDLRRRAQAFADGLASLPWPKNHPSGLVSEASALPKIIANLGG